MAKILAGVADGMTSEGLGQLMAETAASMTSNHPDYAIVSPLPSCLFRSLHVPSPLFPFALRHPGLRMHRVTTLGVCS